MFNVGPEKLMVVLLIALIVLGPDKLPNAARQIGRYLNEFRRISQGFQQELRSAMDVTDTSAATAAAAAAATAASASPEPPPAVEVDDDPESQPGPVIEPQAATPTDPAPAPAPNTEDDHGEAPPTIPPALGQVDPSRASQA